MKNELESNDGFKTVDPMDLAIDAINSYYDTVHILN